MSMGRFSTYADYQASIKPVDKDAALRHMQALAAEAQRDHDAALWRRFARINPETAAAMAAMLAAEQ